MTVDPSASALGSPLPTVALLTGAPMFVVGWRSGRGLEARRIEAHKDTHQVLRTVSESALTYLADAGTKVKPYSAFAGLELGEAFYVGPGSGSSTDLDSASLTEIIREAHKLMPLAKAELQQKMAFYAVIWGRPGPDRIGFVRKADARAVLARGVHFFTYEQTLKTADRPDLVIEDDFDLILRGQSLFMMNEYRARTLMNDAGLAQAGIYHNVVGLATVLGGPQSITPAASAAFEARANNSINFARRLAKFNAYYESQTLDPAVIRQVAEDRSTNPDAYLDANGVIVADEVHAEAALDLIEGRFFKDPISDEERRADRLSKRKP